MRKWFVITVLISGMVLFVSFSQQESRESAARLRKIYSQSPDRWPAPTIDPGVQWKELGLLPGSPIEAQKDSLKHLIELGKILFFDPRLSGSGKISCASCHRPELNWTDGKERSVGHEGALNKRNSPTIQNSWFYHRLFWDGRARDLEDQAFAPINSQSEMHNDMQELPGRLRQVKEYGILFTAAYGDPRIDPDRIAHAIAVFETTIVSGKSRFDEFLTGNRKALNNKEIRGLHLFRTKARCMNCHNGPLFSDNQFHNNGFHLNGDPANDKGYYMVTHHDADFGKFKTPSLRDVALTGPWMHNGMMKTLDQVLLHYSKGADGNGGSDPMVKTLFLDRNELDELLAFLKAISAPPPVFNKPVIPG